MQSPPATAAIDTTQIAPAGFSAVGIARRIIRSPITHLVVAYGLILAVHAFLGRWTPEYMHGRDLWHFMLSRMIVPIIMLGVLASFIRLLPAALLLCAMFLFVGAISAIKREATGEPFQVSDLFLAGQGMHLFGYVTWDKWLMGVPLLPAIIYALMRLRFRWWSLPLLVACVGLLSTYRYQPVVDLIHKHAYWTGVENLTFSQAESERMNGIGTHLYFSTAGLRLKTFTEAEVQAAMNALNVPPPVPARATPAPDIYVVLGEAWWHDPTDKDAPIDKAVRAGFKEATAISPVYGGTTPNAEFEVLTGVPIKSFMSGIIPYQHYVSYFSDSSRTLARILSEQGYDSFAYHNFERRFWLRDKNYPTFGFTRFDDVTTMQVETQANGWPTDAGLFQHVLQQPYETRPQLHYIVTVSTHGPYAEDKAKDVIGTEAHPGITDYHNRLSAAVDELVKFDAGLRKRGRPYVLVVFGDHLPGIRLHQWKMGWHNEPEVRLHQVPLLVSTNSDDATALRDSMQQRPLFCLTPALLQGLRLTMDDRYLQHVWGLCADGKAVGYVPPEAVIQHQLFTKKVTQ